MRKQLVCLLIAATATTLTAPAMAASKAKKPPKLPAAHPLVVTDPAGDANGLNDQGGLLPASPPSTSQGSDAASDILSFTLARKDDGTKITHLVGTLTLAAPPTTNRDYRITMSAPGCSFYYLEVSMTPLGTKYSIRETCNATATSTTSKFDPVDGAVVGNSIVWTVPLSSLPGDVKVGTPLSVTGAEAAFDEGAAIFPSFDVVSTDSTYKIGQ